MRSSKPSASLNRRVEQHTLRSHAGQWRGFETKHAHTHTRTRKEKKMVQPSKE